MTNDTQRMDAVWDRYPPEDNLKVQAQQCRGNGPRTRVGDDSTPIPKSEWNSGFLKNEDNEKELFSFISRQICKSDVNGPTSTVCSPTGILTYRDFNHATRLRRTPGYSCIWLMQQCMVTVRHMFVRWTATYCCLGAPVRRYTRAIRAVGGFWYRKEVSRHSSSLTSPRSWSGKFHRTDSVPQPNGM